MQAFREFENRTPSFWAFVKYISENLGYSERGSGTAKVYSMYEIIDLCQDNDVNASGALIHDARTYLNKRADLLNNYIESMLMDAETASQEFIKWEQLHRQSNYLCKLPFNKQKGEMRQIAFFTSIINILAEKTIREETGTTILGFDDDPRSLMYVWDDNRNIIGSSSRRFDGAFPSI